MQVYGLLNTIQFVSTFKLYGIMSKTSFDFNWKLQSG